MRFPQLLFFPARIDMERERIEFIDVHSHVNFAAYADDYDAVLCRAHDAGVAVINVGTQIDTSLRAVDLANKYADVYAIIGLHPVHCDKSYHDKKELGEEGKGFVSRGEVFDQSTYKKMALDSKVVAIGECGLDYYRAETDSKYKQKENFIAQIALANKIEKTLMLHIRDASMTLLKSLSLKPKYEVMCISLPAIKNRQNVF